MLKKSGNKFGTVETVRKIAVSFERLRYWERIGIVKPQYLKCGTRRFRRYSQRDIDRAVFVKALVDDEGYSLEGAKRKLEEEAKWARA